MSLDLTQDEGVRHDLARYNFPAFTLVAQLCREAKVCLTDDNEVSIVDASYDVDNGLCVTDLQSVQWRLLVTPRRRAFGSKRLEALLAKHGLKIDDYLAGAGQFRDLYIGTGEPMEKLAAFIAEFRKHCITRPRLDYVDSHNHPNFGKVFVLIPSFCWGECCNSGKGVCNAQ